MCHNDGLQKNSAPIGFVQLARDRSICSKTPGVGFGRQSGQPEGKGSPHPSHQNGSIKSGRCHPLPPYTRVACRMERHLLPRLPHNPVNCKSKVQSQKRHSNRKQAALQRAVSNEMQKSHQTNTKIKCIITGIRKHRQKFQYPAHSDDPSLAGPTASEPPAHWPCEWQLRRAGRSAKY